MAEIVGVHGVKGVVKLKVFAEDPDALLDYSPLHDESGAKAFALLSLEPHKNIFLAELEGVGDRTAAEKLRGVKLYVPRDRLPAVDKKNTFYHADLAGLAAKYPDGRPLGRVLGVANFGAGDLLEIKPEQGASFYVPFTDKCVPGINLAAHEITVDPPAGLLD
jgi:16S rRNA processing protein RimM